jgi:hypothetical protein
VPEVEQRDVVVFVQSLKKDIVAIAASVPQSGCSRELPRRIPKL